MKKLNILIAHVSYQASTGSFIKLLRNSSQFHCYIVGCDSIEKGFSSGSLLVDKFYHISEDNAETYINSIKKIVHNEKINVIISAEEDDLLKFKDCQISQAIYKYIPQKHIFETFKDKYFATQEMSKYGIYVPHNIMNYSEFINTNNTKFIKRKRISCYSRGITIFDRAEITENYSFFSNEYITQEFVNGTLYTIDVFCDKSGTPCSIIPRKEIASKDGTTFKCEIENQQELIDICKKIYNIYCIPGLSNIQFIVDDKPYFIELNPRAAATMIASALSSLNYMDLYISHFLFNENLPSYNEIMNSVKWGSIISRYYEETILIPGDK